MHAPLQPPAALVLAGLGRRCASLLYEALIVVAIVFVGSAALLPFTHGLEPDVRRPLIQFGLLVLLGAYFIYCWTRSGQTLPMKAWRLRLALPDGQPVPPRRAMVRYLVAVIGASCAGLGFVWALWDREGQFLQDRLAGTRIVRSDAA